MAKLFFLLLAFAALPLQAQSVPASVRSAPRSAELFERDWVLMNWALKYFDRDHDILLSPGEAEAAAAEFRRIADSDGDGRVTVLEYREARAFILARY
jgi:hypothetical protein